MIVLVSLIALLRGFLVSTIIRMVHPYIHIHCDFCTCFYIATAMCLVVDVGMTDAV